MAAIKDFDCVVQNYTGSRSMKAVSYNGSSITEHYDSGIVTNAGAWFVMDVVGNYI